MSHRPDFHDALRSQRRRANHGNDATVVQVSKEGLLGYGKIANSRNRLSIASNSSAGQRSTDSSDGTGPRSAGQRRRSSIPRPVAGQSSTRLDQIASSRPLPSTIAARKPVPASSGPTRPELSDIRYQSSWVLQQAAMAASTPSDAWKSLAGSTVSSGTKSVANVRSTTVPTLNTSKDSEKRRPTRPAIVPPDNYTQQSSMPFPPRLIPELQALAASTARAASVSRASSTQPPSIGSISSPSTLFTESPGTWSSRNTTPTSMSSYSPGVVPPLKTSTSGRRSNTVPIPAVHTKTLPRLPALPETLKGAGKITSQPSEPATSTKRKKKKLFDSPAPTPPPRASSVKHKKTESDSAVELSEAHKFSTHQHVVSRHEKDNHLDLRPTARVAVIGGALSTEPELYMSPETHEVPLFLAPPRPSRDGVEYLEPQRPAVVETTIRAERERRDVLGGLRPATEASTSSLPAEQAPATFRNAPQSSNVGTVTRSLPHTARSAPVSRRQTPFTEPELPEAAAARPSTSGGDSPSTRAGFFSRLAMLTRSSRTPDSVSPRKLQRKGPAAGTGYEAYGKLSRKSRKSSMESSQSGSSTDVSEAAYGRSRTPVHSRKPSSGSRRDRSSQSDLDDFAAQRLRPKVMRGGSGRFESDEEEIGVALSIPRTEGLGLQPSLLRESHHTVPASPNSFVTTASSSFSIPAPTLPNSWQSSPRHTAPRRHHDIFGPGSLRSATTSQSSIGSSIPAYARPSTPLHKIEAKISPKPEKKPRRLRWNIFSRSTTPSKEESRREVKAASPPKMVVQITAGPVPRSLPYYAIIDSESDQNIPENLGTFINEAVAPSPQVQEQYFPGHTQTRDLNYPAPSATSRNYDSSVTSFDSLAPPPSFTTASQSRPEETPAPQKKRRLAAVGRIPRVVSRKGRFSIGSSSGKSQAENAMPSTAMTTKPTTKVFDERNYDGRREFLHIPSNRGSDISMSSVSTSLYSTSAPVYMPLQAQRNTARHLTGEEEVWNEYDDFLDHVLAPPSHRYVPPPPHSHMYQAAPLPTIPVILAPNASRKQSVKQTEPQVPGITSIRNARDVSTEPDSQFELELRRSRILSALRSSMDPTSPFTIADYLSENGDWLRYSAKLSDRQSNSSPDHPPIPVIVASENNARMTSKVDNTQQHNAALIDAVARTRNPIAQSELHLSSLMISRWLSFGRVLFSPAHEEVNNSPGRHILVFDGLGNADWSIFCSVTYAAQNTFVHDLKERNGQRPFEPDHAPLNYRRTEIRSLCDQFPFPPSFFSAIVLRFPPAMTDTKMRNIISECMRVLAPGGYLELMLLDLDIVNMGTITRRAMRDLKIRITTQDRALSLKPLSDNIQSHLGQQGFPSLSRCVVGVPVVGNASASTESPSSSRSSGESYGRQQAPAHDVTDAPGFRQHRSSRSHGQNFSLSDLVADHSDNADAKIGKMVSRTARNWWQHCFEASVIPDGDLSRSIFTDKKLIRECKARSSNFKLLIAYTQKPTDNRRRTLSEPSMPTLATSGIRRPKQT